LLRVVFDSNPSDAREVEMHRSILALCLVGGFVLPVDAQQSGPSAIPVGTVAAEWKPISKSMDFVGRVNAVDRVEVRARVKGFLDAVLFKEGDLIKQGDPLYRIEKGLFEAQVQQAAGTLERSKAAYTLAVLQRERAEELLARSTGTAVARDQAVAQEQQTKGAIATDEASLLTAKINLGYTDIVAPVTGKISRTNLTKGNVVGPDSGVLTMIVSQNPMYVTFPVSQREFLRVQESGRQVEVENIKVWLKFSDGATYREPGQINFVDVTVDRATDTVIARATMPNTSGGLVDGQLVRVVLEAGTPEKKIVIPQAALIADQQGVYVFAVEDDKAAVKRLKLGAESVTDVVIESGLSVGEQIIVEGLQSIRPGAAVRPSPLMQALSRN
jgi:membrane fusion protein, multidrug efflux system